MSQAACRQQNNQEEADVRPGCGLGALDTRRGGRRDHRRFQPTGSLLSAALFPGLGTQATEDQAT